MEPSRRLPHRLALGAGPPALGKKENRPPTPHPAPECRRPEDAPSVLTRSGIPPQGPSPPLWLQLPGGFKLLTLLLYSVSCPSGQTLISYCELDLATRIVIKAMVAVFEGLVYSQFPFCACIILLFVTQSCQILWDPMDCIQHARLPCPSLSPRACSNFCPTISFSVIPFCPQFFPASGSFPVSQLLASGGQSIGTSDIFSFTKILKVGT